MYILPYTITLLFHPDGKQVLLLRRRADKKVWPNKITGVGGKIELLEGEAANVEASALREVLEETPFTKEEITNLRLRVVLLNAGQEEIRFLSYFTAQLTTADKELTSSEGTIFFAPTDHLPDSAEIIPSTSEVLKFLLNLPPDDTKVYLAHFDHNEKVVIN